MEKMTERIEAQGGIISTSELNGTAEYERLRRAAQRGEVVKLRHGVYAEPTALYLEVWCASIMRGCIISFAQPFPLLSVLPSTPSER